MKTGRKYAKAIFRALEAETNEATFRKLLQDTLAVLTGLPEQTPESVKLTFRILDTLEHTKSVKARDDVRAPEWKPCCDKPDFEQSPRCANCGAYLF